MKVINPDTPEPYCYESDYRKIPRKYLNPVIPKGGPERLREICIDKK